MKRNRILDVLKGICLIFVITTHYSLNSSVRNTYLFPFWIDMAIPLCMLISGYVYTLSFQRKGITSLSQVYLIENGFVLEPIIRYTVPFLIVYFLEIVAYSILNLRDSPSLSYLVREITCGGVGPGSYYFPILIQLIFLFPLIYFSIYRHKTKGLIYWCTANVIFEFLQWAYGLNVGVYRLLIFRYILLISFGCYIALGGRLSKRVSFALAAIGLVACYLNAYKGITLFFITSWKTTSFVTALFMVPAFYYLLKIPFGFKPLEILGKASYNIFLTQMVFYTFGVDLKIMSKLNGGVQSFVVCMGVCLIGGVLFYYIEKSITKKCIALSRIIISKLCVVARK